MLLEFSEKKLKDLKDGDLLVVDGKTFKNVSLKELLNPLLNDIENLKIANENQFKLLRKQDEKIKEYERKTNGRIKRFVDAFRMRGVK